MFLKRIFLRGDEFFCTVFVKQYEISNFKKNQNMKTSITLFFALFISISFGQTKLVWHEDLGVAMEIANKTNKPLMMFFTGSDWCGWCIRLQKEVFFKEEFTKWANENVVLLELDYPKRKVQSPEVKSQNSSLQRQFKVQGYPTVWFVNAEKDSQGQVLFKQIGKTGYVRGGPEVWILNAKSLLGSK